jgi:phosphoglycolate phosphatase-like HAD superfamily hydrolase
MLGDTVYDVRAANAAGVQCIGLMCGGIGERELQEAGALAVYGNVAELFEELATHRSRAVHRPFRAAG